MGQKFLRRLFIIALTLILGASVWIPSPAYADSKPLTFSYVYRTSRTFTAGRTYIIETRDLKKRSWWQSSNPDTVLYVLDGNNIVARNDDWGGFRSLLTFSPSATKSYTLIVRSYRSATIGYFDLYIDNGRIADNVKFGGARIYSRWKNGECFQTTSLSSGDPYFYLLNGDYVGGQMNRNDDGGSGLNSKICVSNNRTGFLIIGSWSSYSEGSARLNLYWHSFHDDPS